jgi:hypothetical protein
MKSALFLRIAAVVTFIQAVLHTIGGVFGDPAPGSATVAVQAMKVNQFLVMGNTRSYWNFYRGFGLAITISLAAEAILFWQLAKWAKTDAARVRPILATFLIAYAALGVNAYAYFFAGPLIAEIIVVACLGLAIVCYGSKTGTSNSTEKSAPLSGALADRNQANWSPGPRQLLG